jgi:hypothetical protein
MIDKRETEKKRERKKRGNIQGPAYTSHSRYLVKNGGERKTRTRNDGDCEGR